MKPKLVFELFIHDNPCVNTELTSLNPNTLLSDLPVVKYDVGPAANTANSKISFFKFLAFTSRLP